MIKGKSQIITVPGRLLESLSATQDDLKAEQPMRKETKP
jgi:hypothetical protein